LGGKKKKENVRGKRQRKERRKRVENVREKSFSKKERKTKKRTRSWQLGRPA
jgi:hypothetical protein